MSKKSKKPARKIYRDHSVYNAKSFDYEQNTAITKKISSLYASILEAESREDVEQPPRLRPSGLPACSILALDKLIDYNLEGKENRNYMSDFFMRVGTEIHSILDKWCAHSDGVKVWGNWKCSNAECGESWKHSTESTCQECNSKGIYDEVEIEYRGMKGHMDCVLVTNKGVVVVDYKTASSYKAAQDRFFKMGTPQYPLQLFVYTYMLDRVYGKHFKDEYSKDVIGCGLLYISRDNPSKYKVFSWGDIALTQGKILLRAGSKRWSLARKCLSKGRVSKSLFSHRLCRNKDDYFNNKREFFYGGCPHFDKCVGKGDNLLTIRKHLNSGLNFLHATGGETNA